MLYLSKVKNKDGSIADKYAEINNALVVLENATTSIITSMRVLKGSLEKLRETK